MKWLNYLELKDLMKNYQFYLKNKSTSVVLENINLELEQVPEIDIYNIIDTLIPTLTIFIKIERVDKEK